MAELNAELLEDVQCARDSLRLLEAAGFRAAFWEPFWMLHGAREPFRAEVGRLKELHAAGKPVAADKDVLDKLANLRRRLGPLVEDLRKFCATLSGAPQDEHLEMMLGFMMISPRALEMVPRWLFDPAQWTGEATEKVRAIAAIVDGYRVARAPEDGAPRPASAPAQDKLSYSSPLKVAAAAPPASQPGAAQTKAPLARSDTVRRTQGPDPEVVEDLRCVEQCRAIVMLAHPELEAWEVMCLMATDRDATRESIAAISRLKSEGRADELTQASKAFYEKVLAVREQYGRLAKDVRTYVAELPIGHFGSDTMEVAFGFILAAPRGRQRAEEWLTDPQRHKTAAMDRLEDVIRRAMMYQGALRSGASAPVSSQPGAS